MNRNFQLDVRQFWQDGYLLIKNVFSQEEIKSLRESIYQQFEVDKQSNYVLQFCS